MKKQVFASLALGLVTAWTTPMVLSQSASATSSDLPQDEHQFSGKDWHHGKDTAHFNNIRASKLIGINVTSKDGENLGQVQDFVIDPKSGAIKFALVGQGFMAGLGEKLIPVPWQAVNVKSEREFALKVDKSKMQSAPAWSQAEEAQPDYVISIYRFYDLTPMEGIGGTGQSEIQSGQAQGSSDLKSAPENNNGSLNQSGQK